MSGDQAERGCLWWLGLAVVIVAAFAVASIVALTVFADIEDPDAGACAQIDVLFDVISPGDDDALVRGLVGIADSASPELRAAMIDVIGGIGSDDRARLMEAADRIDRICA